MIKYLVVDTETGVHNRGDNLIAKGMAASPWHPDNKIEWLGWRRWDSVPEAVAVSNRSYSTAWDLFIKDMAESELLVGQNIKFDLHYLRKNDPDGFMDRLDRISVWDTMLVDYLLSAQQNRMSSLDAMTERLGREVKDSRIKELWDAGVNTEDIPPSMIAPYLQADVLNTEAVFLDQFQRAEALGMLPLIIAQNEALLATFEMEWNGMYFNKKSALSKRHALVVEQRILETAFADLSNTSFEGKMLFTPSSPQHISLVLFGGEFKIKEDVPQMDEEGNPIRYKTGAKAGQIKTRKENVVYYADPISSESMERFKEPTKTPGIYVTSDDVLKSISEDAVDKTLRTFASNMITYRGLTKDISTYYDGYMQYVWPDGKIHPSLNQCLTGTGRLSCSAPNLQNSTHEE